ncbi:MAG: putative ABC transporter permease [Candidatus Pacearchaeota archaeon]|nr:putative ABC transporter permease [Candidatus Pacearchaeota archaeon]
MQLVEIFIIFLIGSLAGYILELIYRNLTKSAKINPGFLKGPYLPIWGITTIIFFIVCELNINLIYKILILITLPTILELITGYIFKEYFKIKLWDYTTDFLNYKGIICLQFSIYWALLSLFYYLILHTHVKEYFLKILSNTSYIFFYGIIAGFFLLDIFYSFNIAFKIRKIRKKIKKRYINFTEFKHTSDIFGDIKDKIDKTLKEKLKRK